MQSRDKVDCTAVHKLQTCTEIKLRSRMYLGLHVGLWIVVKTM